MATKREMGGDTAYMVKEADAGRDFDFLLVARAGIAVEVDVDGDLCLVRFALDGRRPCCHRRDCVGCGRN